MAHLVGLNRKLDASLMETQLPPDVQAMKFGNLYNRYNAYKDSQLRPFLYNYQMCLTHHHSNRHPLPPLLHDHLDSNLASSH
jgi:hypothetical protein